MNANLEVKRSDSDSSKEREHSSFFTHPTAEDDIEILTKDTQSLIKLNATLTVEKNTLQKQIEESNEKEHTTSL